MQLIEAPDIAQRKLSREFGSDRRNLFLLAGACLLLFFLALGSWGFIDPGDGYFSEAAREMIERGDYITPHLNYQIYFSKPILIFWLIIGAYKVFGINEFAARICSAVPATLAVFSCYWTMRCVVNKRAGLIAGLVLATSPLVITFARMSLIDMGFAALLGIALCATVMTLCTNSRRWWPVIYTALGLAVLDKGPAAAVLYAIGMFGYFVAIKPDWQKLKDIFGKLHVVPGLVLFTAIAVPWYIAVGLATGGLWPQVFFVFENLGRFAGHTNHKVPYWWFYLPVIAYGFFPWSLFFPASLVAPARDAWRRWLDRTSPEPPAPFATRETHDAELLLACWAVGVLLFFSLSMTKLQTYVLPAWPAMAMLTGLLIDRWLNQPETAAKSKYLVVCGWVIAAVGFLVGIAAVCSGVIAVEPSVLAKLHGKWAARGAALLSDIDPWLRAGVVVTGAIAGAGLIATWAQLRSSKLQQAIRALVVTAVAAGTIGGIVFYQLGYKYKNADVHRVIESIKDKPGAVALFRDFKPSVVYHLQRPVDTFFATDQLRARSSFPNPPSIQYIIAGPKGASDLMAAYPQQLQVVSKSGDWYVFSSTDLVALRLPTLEQSFKQHIDLSGGEFSWGTLPFAGGTKP